MNILDLTNGAMAFAASLNVDPLDAALVPATIVGAFVGALTPKKLRVLALAYIASMAVAFYLHQTQAVYLGVLVGVATAAVMYPFRNVGRAKRA